MSRLPLIARINGEIIFPQGNVRLLGLEPDVGGLRQAQQKIGYAVVRTGRGSPWGTGDTAGKLEDRVADFLVIHVEANNVFAEANVVRALDLGYIRCVLKNRIFIFEWRIGIAERRTGRGWIAGDIKIRHAA